MKEGDEKQDNSNFHINHKQGYQDDIYEEDEEYEEDKDGSGVNNKNKNKKGQDKAFNAFSSF